MDPRQQSSFIPKKPVVDNGINQSNGIALFPLITTSIFIIVVVISVGIFGYNYFLKKNIETMNSELEGMQKNFQSTLIDDLILTDKRIENAKKILDNHISASSLFKVFELLTVKTVKFDTFSFSSKGEGSIDVALEGVGKNYNSIAYQSDIFRKTDDFVNPIFYDLALDENGDVLFKIRMTIKSSLVSYDNSLLPVEAPPVSSTTSTSTSTSTSTNPTGSGNSGSLN